MSGAIIVLITVLAVGGVTPTTDIKAVKEYWLTAHRTPPPDTVMADPSFGIETVPAWSLFRELLQHRLYCFREGATAHSSSQTPTPVRSQV